MRARKALGQNFLVDANIQRKVAEAIDPRPEDHILEIGPGLGAITQHLAGKVRTLSAVELDPVLASRLAQQFAGRHDVRIIQADILKLPLSDFTADTASLKVAGNIPYNITTPILFHLLQRKWRPAHIVLMVQKEVADRILATAGEEAYGALSIGVQSIASVLRLFQVSRNSFRPVPNVDSTVIRITPFRPFPLSEREESDLRALTRVGFGWRRKQLRHTLRAAPNYKLGIDQLLEIETATRIHLERRPESLSIAEIQRLAAALRMAGRPRETS